MEEPIDINITTGKFEPSGEEFPRFEVHVSEYGCEQWVGGRDHAHMLGYAPNHPMAQGYIAIRRHSDNVIVGYAIDLEMASKFIDAIRVEPDRRVPI